MTKRRIKNNSKAQVSLEFLIVIAMGVLAISGLAGYIVTTQKNGIIINETAELLMVMADNINAVYQSPIGTQKEIIVKFPSKLQQITSNNEYLIIKIKAFGSSTISESTKKTLSPVISFNPSSFPTTVGMHKLVIKKITRDNVEVSI